MTLDMTSGSPGRKIIRFALPLMFSMLLQQLYTFCDSLIVGRFLGAVALTATGAAGGLHWFAQNLLGCAVNGFSVALSQRFGARDRESYRAHFAGAMVLARIARLVIGTDDPKTGACGSLYNIASDERLNHSIEITRGVLAEECSAILKDFFRSRR